MLVLLWRLGGLLNLLKFGMFCNRHLVNPRDIGVFCDSLAHSGPNSVPLDMEGLGGWPVTGRLRFAKASVGLRWISRWVPFKPASGGMLEPV